MGGGRVSLVLSRKQLEALLAAVAQCLHGGDAGHKIANVSNSGYSGVAAFKLGGVCFHQSVLVNLGLEWMVYTCASAGLELSDTCNGTDFQVILTLHLGAIQCECLDDETVGSMHNNNFVMACQRALATLLL
ncbi:uncharacterized protein ACA1_375060 [Acanthamoeba castellanii str. Neff]|uniref:Uncharacterized protein n=1 Tax=Acanthamoeba castellanii (strain ATCC 30010 / Neff) TaxID=1257118 RepID=L8GHD0_ACACF|nr:uncharacterized protein ACA1_375060 [Acanthamoeba castellanii str. Neff]ELR12407.1 hypothetical protein ACA1_375060 [Acanthamoeba castellanii str. Neff]